MRPLSVLVVLGAVIWVIGMTAGEIGRAFGCW